MCKAARTPVISHDRPSPRLEFCGWTPFPTLSISDAERRAYHNRRVSDARYPQRIFDTLWILVRSTPIPGRTKARPYDRMVFSACIMLNISRVGSRLAATYHGCGANENPQRVEDTLWIVCVGDAPFMVSPALSIGDA